MLSSRSRKTSANSIWWPIHPATRPATLIPQNRDSARKSGAARSEPEVKLSLRLLCEDFRRRAGHPQTHPGPLILAQIHDNRWLTNLSQTCYTPLASAFVLAPARNSRTKSQVFPPEVPY